MDPSQIMETKLSRPAAQAPTMAFFPSEPPLEPENFNDVPDLLDGDDSNTDSDDVPELVGDASDSEDDISELSDSFQRGDVVASRMGADVSRNDGDVSDDDSLPGLEDADDTDDDDDEPPLLVGLDSDQLTGNLGAVPHTFVDEKGFTVNVLPMYNGVHFGKGKSYAANLTQLHGQTLVDGPGVRDYGWVRGEERPVENPGEVKRTEPQEWSTGLFDCCVDMPSCLLGAFCPCILYAQTRQLLTGLPCIVSAFTHVLYVLVGSSLGGCFLCHWGYAPCAAAPLRSLIRNKYGLAVTGPFETRSAGEGMMADCLVHYWCHPCALCQEHREVKLRIQKEQGPVYTTPPIVEKMEKRAVVEPIRVTKTEEEAGGVYYTLLAGE